MNINPEHKTIKMLLKSGKQYLIPRFQREYSWDRVNYQEFLRDTIKGITLVDGKLKSNPYFLGTMLFIGKNSGNNSHLAEIVDGQQRLTSITILFSAISDKFKAIENTELSERIFEYIMTKDDDGNDVRILQSKTHYPFFSYFIQDSTKSMEVIARTEEEKCINETYLFFKSSLEEKNLRKTFADVQNSDVSIQNIEYTEFLKAIRDQVLGMIFVSITTEDKTQANTIFEILNGKGKKLADIDLIKNRIFEVLSTTEPADFADVEWNEIKNILANEKESVGFATFFHHYWISRYSYKSKTSLYDDFKKRITPANEETYQKFLKSLKFEAKEYIKFVTPSREHHENRQEYYWLV